MVACGCPVEAGDPDSPAGRTAADGKVSEHVDSGEAKATAPTARSELFTGLHHVTSANGGARRHFVPDQFVTDVVVPLQKRIPREVLHQSMLWRAR